MKHIKKITYISILTLGFFSAGSVLAADLSFESPSAEISQNSDVLVTVFLNTDGESLNTVQGKIVFPPDIFRVKEVRDGNSSINFWVERPHVVDPGTIVFSGITPGGFSRPKEVVFSVVFTAKKIGSGRITAKNLHMLKNDGNGTEVTTTVSDLVLSISAEAQSGGVEGLVDLDMPEDFKPSVGKDLSLFSGQNFLVFATQDKGSGVDHYEVAEDVFVSYVVAESPYLLQNQSLNAKIYVKAVDKAGNERVVSLDPSAMLSIYELLLILGIIFIICFFILKKIRARFAQ